MNHSKSISVRLLVAALFCFPTLLKSQGLTVNFSQLNFGVAYENAPDSLLLTIQNPTANAITVTGIKFYTTYGQPAFSSQLTSAFTISGGGSQTTWIRFSPRHNILHNTEMVIENDGLRGFISVDLIGQVRYSKGYYAATENTSEEALKNQIGNITGIGYVSLGYNDARDEMFMSIDNKRVNGQGASQNTLECVYTGRLAVGYVDRSDCQTSDNFNTEHTWPQSLFASAEPMKSDLHHLFPTDDAANSARGDNPFAEVTNPTWSNGGSIGTNTFFEPRDEQKGIVARAMFYFVLRYQNYSNFLDATQESVLRNWYNSFPVTDRDRTRVDDIEALQHNRNPFVDYPQFLERIRTIVFNSVEQKIFSFDLTQDTAIFGFVPSNTAADFNYVLVNNGNTAIDISNIQLTHPAELSFTSGGANATLQPGEAHNIGIQYLSPTTDSVRAFLSFELAEVGGSGQQNVSIPVFVNDLIFSNISDVSKLTMNVYPNPAHERVYVSTSTLNSEFQLMSLDGKIIVAKRNSSASTIEFDLNDIASGTYILKQISQESIQYSKIIVY